MDKQRQQQMLFSLLAGYNIVQRAAQSFPLSDEDRDRMLEVAHELEQSFHLAELLATNYGAGQFRKRDDVFAFVDRVFSAVPALT